MKSKHSWKWLAPRFSSRHLRTGSAEKGTGGRRCLALERLEDRNLLSAAGTSITVGPPPTGDTQVLVDLTKWGLGVTQDEFALLQALGSSTPPTAAAKVSDIVIVKTVDKASHILFKLNDTLVKLGEDLIKGESTDHKHPDEVQSKIEYLKIKLTDVIISSVSSDAQQKCMLLIDSLFTDASDLVKGLASIEGAGTATQKQTVDFMKMADDFLKIDDLTLKADLDFLKAGSPGVGVGDFQHKIDAAFMKLIGEIKLTGDQTLLGAVQDYQAGVTKLLGSLSSGGNFGGGVVLPPNTSDVIA